MKYLVLVKHNGEDAGSLIRYAASPQAAMALAQQSYPHLTAVSALPVEPVLCAPLGKRRAALAKLYAGRPLA